MIFGIAKEFHVVGVVSICECHMFITCVRLVITLTKFNCVELITLSHDLK
jgi:hypothetical protein